MGGLGWSALHFLGFTALVKIKYSAFDFKNLTFYFYSAQLKKFCVSFCVDFGIHTALEESTWEHVRNHDTLYNVAVPCTFTQKNQMQSYTNMLAKYLIYPFNLMYLNCEWLVGVLELFGMVKNVFMKAIKQGEIRLIGHPPKNKIDKNLLNEMEHKCHYL